MSTLNKWFAVSSLILLLAVILVLSNDFFRSWKGYQREFRQMEAEKTRVLLEKETTALEKDSKFKALQKTVAEAEAGLAQNQAGLNEAEDSLKKLDAKDYRFNQKFNFSKAEYDVAKYKYEDAVVHGGDVVAAKAELDGAFEVMDQKRATKEKNEDEIALVNKKIKGFENAVFKARQAADKLKKKGDLLQRKLSKIDIQEMTLGNKMASLFRDLPMVDFLSPSFKIRQIVIPDITDDVKFTKVPRVDRCITCHQGMDNSLFEGEANPFKVHPNLDLFLTSKSPHPVEEFGCTSCHGGRGRGTSFVNAVHVPANKEQLALWEEDHHYHQMHLWEEPMYPKQYVEAGCFQCHSQETRIQGADKLSLGLALIDKAGCYGCHNMEPFKDHAKRGPDLGKIASKANKDWLFRWIKDPKGFRPTTWMPAFFNQTNSNDPEAVKRNDQEIHAIAHYLRTNSQSYSPTRWPGRGNVLRGKKLVASVGCMACHQLDSEAKTRSEGLNEIGRQHGPNLIGMGSKTSADWIYDWLKNPSQYSPHTKMPNLRLTQSEAADITAFLIGDKNDDFMAGEVPAVDEAILDKIILEGLSRLNTENAAKGQLSKMDLDAKLEFTGKKMISKYGCFGCHNIKGFEKVNPIGADLTKIGSKPVHKLDFGYVHLEHSNHAWFTQKLKNPRVFDKGFVRAHDDKLKMPNFGFSDSEIEAIVTALLGFKANAVKVSKRKPNTVNNALIADGQKIIQKFNCKGCHIIEGDGGGIEPTITEWLKVHKNMDDLEAEALTKSYSPPNLVGEGKKVQTDWLFHFLSNPETIRPWLQVRMPTFSMTTEEKNGIIKYFSALDNEDFPFTRAHAKASAVNLAAGKKLFSADYLNCGTCHIQGSKFPSGSPDSWAPDFALAKTRLKPDWVVDWLINPIGLLPGTKMPSFYDPENMDQSGPPDVFGGKGLPQIEALRDYVFSIK